MRKQSLPPELASLTNDQIAQVNHWLDRFTYPKVQQLFFQAYRVHIGEMKLCRYYKRVLKARALSTAAQPALTPADLVALKNGTPIPDARLNNELLQRRVLDLVRNVKSAYELRELQQVATYDQRRALAEKELELEKRAAQYRLWRADFRERDLAFRRAKVAAHSHCEAANHSDPADPPPIAFPLQPNESKLSQ
jgi:hypothetical protein